MTVRPSLKLALALAPLAVLAACSTQKMEPPAKQEMRKREPRREEERRDQQDPRATPGMSALPAPDEAPTRFALPVPGAATGAATGRPKKRAPEPAGTADVEFSEGAFTQAPEDADGAITFDTSGESYAHAAESRFRDAVSEPLSTFSIDVDTASYSNVRRFLLDNRQLPPSDAVRIEEMLNTFRYDDPPPRGHEPFSVTTETASCPWSPGHRLLRIALRGREVAERDLPPRNLVFLVDVSGSMDAPNKLPLVQRSLRDLASRLTARDSVAIVVYAGAAGLMLEPTPASRQDEILRAIDGLRAGGSTNGAGGIELAYRLAEESFIEGGANRVVLCTDGDFNVGMTSQSDLVHLIELERDKGVFLTVLGYGMGNLKDSTMESLADHGNGNYAYIDSFEESRKVLVDEADAWLVTIAKDVKIQVEMNPRAVASWRLVGYDNRRLANEDFEDDRKDAGEIGAGHAVVALYELVPSRGRDARGLDELGIVRLRWKEPDGDTSIESAHVIPDRGGSMESASPDMRFAAAIATFGLALKDSELAPDATFGLALELARGAVGRDGSGRRAELVQLVQVAQGLAPARDRMLTTR